MKVTILGGGVIGLCCAYYLRKEGYEVTLIDRGDISGGCSFGNMGYISPSHFIPLASPGIVKQGLKWMLSSTSPFYIKPRLNFDLIRWGLRFWRSAKEETVSKNIPHLNNLLQLSRREMNHFNNELPGLFNFTEKGCWMLYKSEKSGDHEKALAEQANLLGLKTIACNAAEVQARETEVEVDVAGGVLYLDDAHLQPQKFMETLFHRLQEMGVQFWLNSEVHGFKTKDRMIVAVMSNEMELSCGELIVANGSWMEIISKKLGINIPVQPGKGYSVVYNGLARNLQFPSILVDDRTATTPIGSWLRIGGTMELSGHSDNILPKRVSALHRAFKKYYPKMDLKEPDASQAWYGYRPVTPDGLPYIGRHPKFDNLSYAGGHAMLGVSAAAGTGKLMEEIIGGKKTTIEIIAFDPARFS